MEGGAIDMEGIVNYSKRTSFWTLFYVKASFPDKSEKEMGIIQDGTLFSPSTCRDNCI
jgi:hypothetical protein